MPNANLYFKFRDSTTKAGATGLTVTANVFKLTKSGTKTTVASAASCAEVGGGLYAYNLSSPDFATYDYVATAIPSSTTGLDNADSDALWADFAPDVQARVPAALNGSGNMKADVLQIAGQTTSAAGAVTFPGTVAAVGSPMTLDSSYNTLARQSDLGALLVSISDYGDAHWTTATGFAVPGDEMSLIGAYDGLLGLSTSYFHDVYLDTLAAMPNALMDAAYTGHVAGANTLGLLWATAAAGGGGLTQSDVRAALGMAAANLDTQLAAIALGGVPPETAAVLAAADQILLVELYEPSDVPEVIIPAPASDLQTNAYLTTFNGEGGTQGNVNIIFQLVGMPSSGSHTQKPFQRTSAASGQLVVPLTKSTDYKAKRGEGEWVTFTTGSATSFALPAILGQ